MNYSPFSFHNLRGAVKWLLFINLAAFLLQKISGGTLENLFSLAPIKVWGSLEIWRLFTYLFLHGSFFHFFFNMFVLWMFGKEIENAWGTREFIKYYLICGIGAGFFNLILQPFSTLPIIGSSGAIYGILIAFGLLFPETVIYLYAIIPMRAKHFLILLGTIEFLASFQGDSSTISRIAHLGGMVTGTIYLKSYTFRSFFSRFGHKILDSLFIRKPTPKIQKKSAPITDDALREQVDKILEKILTHGAESLTEKERELMRRYSSRKH